MKLYPEQLNEHLKKNFSPLYFLYGDEILLRNEATAAIGQKALQMGYANKTRLAYETHFNWTSLMNTARSRSLFDDQQFMVLSAFTGKPGVAGGKALIHYAENLPKDTVLLIVSDKLEKTALQSAWFRAIDKVGVTLALWPLKPNQLPGWITHRLQQVGLKTSAGGVKLIADHVVGNLVAAAQEIEKLSLIHGPGEISETDIARAIANNARFDLFDLIDTALSGNSTATLRIVETLRQENSEPVLILWGLTRQLRELANLAQGLARGEALSSLLSRHGVYSQRQDMIQRALGKREPGYWFALLQQAANLDRILKGQAAGNCWNEITELCLGIGGVRVIERFPGKLSCKINL